MAHPKPDVIAYWIEHDSSDGVARMGEVITTVLTGRLPRYSPEEIAELSEQSEQRIITLLRERSTADEKDGITAVYVLEDDGTATYFRRIPGKEIEYLGKLKLLSPGDFEEFCGSILSKMGGTHRVIGGSNDLGCDFEAHGLVIGSNASPVPICARAIVIGQAKRYTRNDVTETEVRQFVGGAIHRVDRLKRELGGDAGILAPVLLAYWTTADFHYSARRYAREMGLWFLNGIGLAQLAIRVGLDPENFGPSLGGDVDSAVRGLKAESPGCYSP